MRAMTRAAEISAALFELLVWGGALVGMAAAREWFALLMVGWLAVFRVWVSLACLWQILIP